MAKSSRVEFKLATVNQIQRLNQYRIKVVIIDSSRNADEVKQPEHEKNLLLIIVLIPYKFSVEYFTNIQKSCQNPGASSRQLKCRGILLATSWQSKSTSAPASEINLTGGVRLHLLCHCPLMDPPSPMGKPSPRGAFRSIAVCDWKLCNIHGP